MCLGLCYHQYLYFMLWKFIHSNICKGHTSMASWTSSMSVYMLTCSCCRTSLFMAVVTRWGESVSSSCPVLNVCYLHFAFNLAIVKSATLNVGPKESAAIPCPFLMPPLQYFLASFIMLHGIRTDSPGAVFTQDGNKSGSLHICSFTHQRYLGLWIHLFQDSDLNQLLLPRDWQIQIFVIHLFHMILVQNLSVNGVTDLTKGPPPLSWVKL